MELDHKSKELYNEIVEEAASAPSRPVRATPAPAAAPRKAWAALVGILIVSGAYLGWFYMRREVTTVEPDAFAAILPVQSATVIPAGREVELIVDPTTWEALPEKGAILGRLFEASQSEGYRSVRVKDSAGTILAVSRPGESYLKP